MWRPMDYFLCTSITWYLEITSFYFERSTISKYSKKIVQNDPKWDKMAFSSIKWSKAGRIFSNVAHPCGIRVKNHLLNAS